MSTTHFHNAAARHQSTGPAKASAQSNVFAAAARRMRRGRRLVVSGFTVTVIGIVGYSLACFAGPREDTGPFLLGDSTGLVNSALGVIGLGTLLWLVGSFLFLSGAMDSDPEGDDLQF